ncbi:isopeptide-forming domain-containing fimbrial protein [Bifidobacterium sp. 64T4]|uniref:isopeptide-forming domain-containing fimbrial protein n=1 Tax=Bifidobacterium pongonis TaxID=2834432 RepID=UPI001C58B747|nr:isopeptide-forming domain-containing fimbrial protein [Bifidobacterium pongonis]MBW3094277.1 isopeptide-forming domain-containing fimbrial protein [Bifidobacterium pongonis]
MKRVVSGLAALGIALSGMALGVSSAYAADTATDTLAAAKNDTNGGKITIKNPNEDTTEHILNGYRLGWLYEVTSENGKLKSFQIDTNDDYVKTIEAALKDVKSTNNTSKSLYELYADSTYYNDTKGGATAPQDEANPLGWIAENIQGNQLAYRDGWSRQNNTELRLFANALKAEFEKTDAPAKTGELKTGDNAVGEGYYLLLDQFDNVTTTAGAAASAKTAQPTQSIPILVTSTIPASVTVTDPQAEVAEGLGQVTLKSSAPSITKQVVDKDGNAVTEPDYNIGEDIYYELTTTIPDYTSYTKCDTTSTDEAEVAKCRKLIVTDTAEKGLTIQSVESVKVGDTALQTAQYDTKLNVAARYAGTEGDANATQSTIDLGKYVNSAEVANNYGATVTIIVKAKLNGNAKISTPNQLQENKNKVSLTYSNKFDKVSDAKTIEGGEVNVYTFKFRLKKTAMDGTTLLNGAKFKVQNKATQKWLKYDTDNAKWTEAADQAGATEFTSDENGMVTGLDGLKQGTYTVKETKPAQDYTTFGLPSFDVTITPEYRADDSTRPANHTGNWGDYKLEKETISLLTDVDTRVAMDETTDATFTIHVKNAKNLTELPMTGGAGLVAVIAVGVLLAGAGTAAAVRSRKSTSRAVRV